MNTNDICCLSIVLIWLSINFVRITCGEESLATEFPSVTSSLSSAISIENTSTIAVLNCTRCNVWKGDDCFKSEPCIFCNESIQCSKESTVCKDNVCLDINWDSSIRHYDPFGKIIALILLTIFMLSILTLCLKVCCTVCGNTNGNLDKRCCLLHCALSIQCCCDWKAGNLRVLPESTNDPGLSVDGALFPQPPPSYIDIFPSLIRQEESRSYSAVDLRNSEEVARVLSRVRSFNAGQWIDRQQQDGGSTVANIMELPGEEGGLTMTTTVA